MRRRSLVSALLTALTLWRCWFRWSSSPASGTPQVPSGNGRVSVSSAEAQANDDSFLGEVSANGRFVVSSSNATNLVPGDTNGRRPMCSSATCEPAATERVSVSSAEVQGNDLSGDASISDDGLLVVFSSDATNLVTGDTNGERDVFVRDRAADTTERVSVSDSEQQSDDRSSNGAVSGDGTKVAFASDATNLVSGDTNGGSDVFLRDLVADSTIRVERHDHRGSGGR